jgi:hypothetical protein
MNRRHFLKQSLKYTSYTALGTVAFLKTNRYLCSPSPSLSLPPSPLPLVVAASLEHHTPQVPSREVYLDALDRGVEKITGEVGLNAYKKLFPGGGRVAIKVNCASRLSPRLSLIEALFERLSAIGIDKIYVWDRFEKDLLDQGYPIETQGRFQFLGTNSLNRNTFWSNPYPKKPEVFPYCLPSSTHSPRSGQLWETSFSSILWDYCDHLINLGVLKDHARCGVSLTIKNTYGMIHNPHRLHGKNGMPYLAEIHQHPLLQAKTRLFLLDGHQGQYHKGPQWASDYLFYPQVLLLSTSGVALDLEGWKRIEEERQKEGFPDLATENRSPTYLQQSVGLSWEGYHLQQV